MSRESDKRKGRHAARSVVQNTARYASCYRQHAYALLLRLIRAANARPVVLVPSIFDSSRMVPARFDVIVADLEDLLDEGVCALRAFYRNEHHAAAIPCSNEKEQIRTDRIMEKARRSLAGASRLAITLLQYARGHGYPINADEFLRLASRMADENGPVCDPRDVESP